MSGSTLSYTECLKDAQSVVDGLAAYGREVTSIVVCINKDEGLRFDIDRTLLTIEYLSNKWNTFEIRLLVFIMRHPKILEWKIVNSAKGKRI